MAGKRERQNVPGKRDGLSSGFARVESEVEAGCFNTLALFPNDGAPEAATETNAELLMRGMI